MASQVTCLISLLTSSRHHNLNFCCHFATQTPQKEQPPFIAQYLISSFGFSEERALKLATRRNFVPIESPDRPESVVRFLKDTGLTDAEIKNTISRFPQLLGTSVRNTLKPHACEVLAAGFSKKILIQLFCVNPQAFTYKNLFARLQFWRNFVGNDEEALLKIMKTRILVNADIDKKVIPRINLFREYGLSDEQILKVIMAADYLVVHNLDSIKLFFEQLENLGIPRTSARFLESLIVIGSFRKDTFDKKIAFFKTTYGWSEEDVNLALRKHPAILKYSEEKVSSTMDFLTTKVGLRPRSIASWPRLIGYSLEKTLIPRYYVLTVLKSKGLNGNSALHTVSCMSEKKFFEKFIFPYKEELPHLDEAYVAACLGKMPVCD